jgi:hypothetical protein
MLWLHQLRMAHYGDAAGTLGSISHHQSTTIEQKREALAMERLCHLATASPGDDRVNRSCETLAPLDRLRIGS